MTGWTFTHSRRPPCAGGPRRPLVLRFTEKPSLGHGGRRVEEAEEEEEAVFG